MDETHQAFAAVLALFIQQTGFDVSANGGDRKENGAA